MEYENSLKSTFSSSFSSMNHNWNFLRRTLNSSFNSSFSNSYSKNLATIKQDISTYEEISSQLYSDLVDLQAVQQRIEYSKTLKGKYFHVLGHFFSLYCIWKIIISFINIVFNRVGKGRKRTIQLKRFLLLLLLFSWSGDEKHWTNCSLFQFGIRCTILVTIFFVYARWNYRCDEHTWIINYTNKSNR